MTTRQTFVAALAELAARVEGEDPRGVAVVLQHDDGDVVASGNPDHCSTLVSVVFVPAVRGSPDPDWLAAHPEHADAFAKDKADG